MCLDLQNFFLTAVLDYYEYTKIPLAVIPEWTKKQDIFDTHTRDSFVFLDIRLAVWGSLKRVFWPINSSKNGSLLMDITNV